MVIQGGRTVTQHNSASGLTATGDHKLFDRGHVTRTVQRDWPGSCFGARNCDEFASNFLCKFLVQVSGTSFSSMSPA